MKAAERQPAAAAKPRPWLEVVVTLRAHAEAERWRTAVLATTPGWQEFAILWRTAAPGLQQFGVGRVLPPFVRGFDDELVWAWEAVDHVTDPLLAVLDERCSLPSGALLGVFDALRVAALIFPDGSVARSVLARMEHQEVASDAGLAGIAVAAQLRLGVLSEKLQKAMAAQKAATP